MGLASGLLELGLGALFLMHICAGGDESGFP